MILEQKIRSIDGIEFKKNNTTVTPKTVFEAYYKGLDELINFNKRRNTRIEAENPWREKRNKSKEKKLFQNWRKSIPEGYKAIATLQNGTKEELTIQERQNLETSFSTEQELRSHRTRRPNILFLQSEDGEALIFRQTKAYNPDGEIARKAQAIYGNKVDRDQYRTFFTDEKELISPRHYLLLPEPNLVTGLETLYESTNLKRVTPIQRGVLTDTPNYDHYLLRPYLDSIRSRPTKVEDMATYLAGMHSLGLTDERDRQKEHYCIQTKINGQNGPSIVNIDPDFLIYAGEKPNKLINDTKAFFKMYKDMQQTVFGTDEDGFKALKQKIQDSYGDRTEEFLEALPKNMQEIKQSYTPLLR